MNVQIEVNNVEVMGHLDRITKQNRKSVVNFALLKAVETKILLENPLFSNPSGAQGLACKLE